jgi:hypothetical protein
MADRLELQSKFEELLGSRNVYFQPPSSISMKYDAIRYALSGKDLKRADNRVYSSMNRYDGVYITKNPDSKLPDRLLECFELASLGSPYTADNLNHFPFTIYY